MGFASLLKLVIASTAMREPTVIYRSRCHLVIGGTLTSLIVVSAMRDGKEGSAISRFASLIAEIMATVLRLKFVSVRSVGSHRTSTHLVISLIQSYTTLTA